MIWTEQAINEHFGSQFFSVDANGRVYDKQKQADAPRLYLRKNINLSDWHIEMDDRLIALRNSGMPWTEIAKQMKRADVTLFYRYKWLAKERGFKEYVRPLIEDSLPPDWKQVTSARLAAGENLRDIAKSFGVGSGYFGKLYKGYYDRTRKKAA